MYKTSQSQRYTDINIDLIIYELILEVFRHQVWNTQEIVHLNEYYPVCQLIRSTGALMLMKCEEFIDDLYFRQFL